MASVLLTFEDGDVASLTVPDNHPLAGSQSWSVKATPPPLRKFTVVGTYNRDGEIERVADHLLAENAKDAERIICKDRPTLTVAGVFDGYLIGVDEQ